MNFQQLKSVQRAVANQCDLQAVARELDTSQTAVGRHIRELEAELGITMFVRTGKRFGGLTEAGAHVFPIVERLIEQRRKLQTTARDFLAQREGPLRVAATHAQARYALPPVIQDYRKQFPDVRLHLSQGCSRQVVAMVLSGEADIAVASEVLEHQPELLSLPCHTWQHQVVVPAGHTLLSQPLTLEALAGFALITYDNGGSSRVSIDAAFTAAGIEPQVDMVSVDADVIKTYVGLGLGVGIVASMAFDPARDTGLRAIDAGHLFGMQTTRLALRRSNILRAYGYAFMESFFPALKPEEVLDAQMAGLNF